MFFSGGRESGRGSGTAAPSPGLAQLRGYWQALRQGGSLPSRMQIDPRGIDRALEFAFIAERIAPGIARFRLAGMHLNDLMGMEVRGMPLSAFFEPGSRPAAAEAVERAFSGTSAVELLLEAERGLGRPALAARLLLLPLRCETGEVRRILGGLAADGPAGRAPRRFRLVSEARTAPAPVASGFTEPVAPYEPWPGRRRAHLRLVYSRD